MVAVAAAPALNARSQTSQMECMRPFGAPSLEMASCSAAASRNATVAMPRCGHAASPRSRGPALSRRARDGSSRSLHLAAAAGARRAGAIFVPRDSGLNSADASAPASTSSKDMEAQLLPQLTASLAAITAPVAEDMAGLSKNLLSIVGSRSPMLMAAAEQIFGAGGKKLRPVLCFLVARATAQAQGLR